MEKKKSEILHLKQVNTKLETTPTLTDKDIEANKNCSFNKLLETKLVRVPFFSRIRRQK